MCERHGLACVPYFGLARGFLTGKYRRDGDARSTARERRACARATSTSGASRCSTRSIEIAAAHDTTVAAVALAWLLAQPTVLAPIASATSPEQLAELLASPSSSCRPRSSSV